MIIWQQFCLNLVISMISSHANLVIWWKLPVQVKIYKVSPSSDIVTVSWPNPGSCMQKKQHTMEMVLNF